MPAKKTTKTVNPQNVNVDAVTTAEANDAAPQIPDPDRDMPKGAIKHIVIKRIARLRTTIPIVSAPGSSLIMHAFGSKLDAMLAAQQLDATEKKGKTRPPRDVDADYEDCFYRIGGAGSTDYGMPALAFKRAMVLACRLNDLTMTTANQLFHVLPDDPSTGYVRIRDFSEPERLISNVRLATGVASVAIRPQFLKWAADITIEFNPAAISLQSIANLLEQAGDACGVGDWRPERKGGIHGRFMIDADRFGAPAGE